MAQTDSTTLFDTILRWLADPGFTIIVILLIGWLCHHFGGVVIARLIHRLIRSTQFNILSAEDVRKRQDTLINLFSVIWRALVIVVVGTLVFMQLFPKVDLTPVFASAGIIGIALGFGAQSIIKDFLSGMFIIMENQYRVGDIVDIEGASGTVERITIRSTIVRDADGNVHFIPNGSIVQVINKTMGYSRVNLTLNVDPDTNVDTLSDVINKAGIEMSEDEKWSDKIITPPHFLSIGSFSDLALEVKVTAKTQPSFQWAVTDELRKRLLKELNKHKIELAHPFTSPDTLKK